MPPARPHPRRDRLHQRRPQGQGDRRMLGQSAQRGRPFRDYHSPRPRAAPDAMPAQIAVILAHELVHAAVGIAAGHGKAFKRTANGLDLIGPMRATTPRDGFLATIAPVLANAGPLPHARLDTGGETSAPRKQATRILKCECRACGYTVRTARKWLRWPVHPFADLGMGRCSMIRSTNTGLRTPDRPAKQHSD